MVHHTMATSTKSASKDSRTIQPMIRGYPRFACVMLLLCIAGCATPPVAPPVAPPKAAPPPRAFATYKPVDWHDLPGWTDDDISAAWPAFRVGCNALVANPKTQSVWQTPCDEAVKLGPTPDRASVRAFFEAQFTAYRVLSSDGAETARVTGYYEPLLEGSLTRTERFSVPLYAPPDDLLTVDLGELYPELKDKRVRGRLAGNRVIPYWARGDIDAGLPALDGKALVFVGDPVEAFFLEIQGSGRIRLADGHVMRVGYADQNGWPFRSIARVLIDRGELSADRASMQAIKAWGRAHPEQLPALLAENPSYVFFRENPAPAAGTLEAQIDGPIGTLGVPLAAERTIAVDPRAIPLGAPVFLATTRPLSAEPLDRLVLAQDTGGAIRGALRVDYFWGFGDAAGREAGRMRQDGRLWLLWPKGTALP